MGLTETRFCPQLSKGQNVNRNNNSFFIQKRCVCNFFPKLELELVTTLEEVDCLQFGTHGILLLLGEVLKGSAVGTEVQAYEFHVALAAHDDATEMADDIDNLLREVLQIA